MTPLTIILIGVVAFPALAGWAAGRVFGLLTSLLYYAALAWIVSSLNSWPQPDLFAVLAEFLLATAVWAGALWSLYTLEA